MAYVALKPCCFAGQKFWIGETIPDGLVLPEMAGRLIEMGKLAEMPEHSSKLSDNGSKESGSTSEPPDNDSEESSGASEPPDNNSKSPPGPRRKPAKSR